MKKGNRVLAFMLVMVMVASAFMSFNTGTAEAASSSKYWIKVNKQANVATAYEKKNGKWEPMRAMLTSCGGSATPRGTFNTTARYRWKGLINGVKGQYSTRIVGSILFHSVWYSNGAGKHQQNSVEFNKLGRTASHGCVRLSVMDSKWVYDNCGIGTKVTIYSSSNPGPLGKPTGIKVNGYRGWDPTDPDPKNPRYKIKPPTISFSKTKQNEVQTGDDINLLSGVKAVNKFASQNVSNLLKVEKVEIQLEGRYKKYKMNTKRLGKYKVTYVVKDKYSGTARKTFIVNVVDKEAPIISDDGTQIYVGDKNLIKGITAKTGSGKDITSTMKVSVLVPGGAEYKDIVVGDSPSIGELVKGEYKIRVTATNPANGKKTTKEITRIVMEHDGVITAPASYDVVKEGTAEELKAEVKEAIKSKTTIKDNNIDVLVTTEMIKYEGGDKKAIITYVSKNGKTVTKEVIINYPAKPEVPEVPQVPAS